MSTPLPCTDNTVQDRRFQDRRGCLPTYSGMPYRTQASLRTPFCRGSSPDPGGGRHTAQIRRRRPFLIVARRPGSTCI